MDTNNFGEGLASLMEPELSDIEYFAEQLEVNEWASAASVVHTEEERKAVMEAAKKAKYKLTRSGSSFSLSRSEEEESIIEELITEGKETPYTKGPGNPVQQLDGSTKPSRSKVAGVPLPWYAWDAVPIEEDVHRKLADILPQMFRDCVNRVKGAFAQTFVAPFIQKAIVGGAT